jgi:hypothetical protein
MDGEAIALAGSLADIAIRNGQTNFAAYAAAVKSELGPAWSQVKASLYGAWMAAAGQYDVQTIGRAQAQSVIDALDAGRDPTAPGMKVAPATPGAIPTGPNGERVSAIKRAFVEPTRESLGMEASEPMERQTQKQIIEEARDRLAANPTEGATLIDDLAVNPRPMTAEDVGLLNVEIQNRRNAFEAAEKLAVANPANATLRKLADAARTAYEKAYDVVASGESRSITMMGRALAMLRTVINEEFDVVHMERVLSSKQGGKELTQAQKDQVAELRRDNERIQAEREAEMKVAQEQLKQVEGERNQILQDLKFQKLQVELYGKRFSKTQRAKEVIARANEQEDIADDYFARRFGKGPNALVVPTPQDIYFLGIKAKAVFGRALAEGKDGAGAVRQAMARFGAMFSISQEDTDQMIRDAIAEHDAEVAEMVGGETRDGELVPAVRKPGRVKPKAGEEATDDIDADQLARDIKTMVKEQIMQGVTDSDVAIRNVTAILNETMDIAEDVVREKFVDYGRTVEEDQAAEKVLLRKMRREQKKLADIKRMLKGEAPIRAQRSDVKEPKERDLIRQVQRMLKNTDFGPDFHNNRMKTAQERVKRGMENRIADMEYAMKQGERMAGNRDPVLYDAAMMDLKRNLDQMRERYNAMFPTEKAEQTPEQRLAAAKERLRRERADKQQQLADGTRKVRAKKPTLNDAEADAIRADIAELDAALGELDASKAEDAAKAVARVEQRLQKQIDAIDEQIEKGRRPTRVDGVEPDTENIRRLTALRDARRAMLDEIAPRTLTEEQRTDRFIAHLDRTLAKAEKDLRDATAGKFTEPIEKWVPKDVRVKFKKDQIAAIKKEIAELKEAKFPYVAAINAALKRRQAIITRMENQIKTGDFSKKDRPQYDLAWTPEGRAVMREDAEVRERWAKAKEAARWDSLTGEEKLAERSAKLWRTVYEITRSLTLSVDNSVILNQMGTLVLTHPKIMADATIQSLAAIASKDQSAKSFGEIADRPNWSNGVYKASGIQLSQVDATGEVKSADDANYQSTYIESNPVTKQLIGRSQQGFAAGANIARAAMFDLIMMRTEMGRNIMKKGAQKLSKVELNHIKNIAQGVNILTGTIKMNRSFGPGMSAMFMAPRFATAILSDFIWLPVLKAAVGSVVATGESRKSNLSLLRVLGQEWAMRTATQALVVALANLYRPGGADDEDKPELRDWKEFMKYIDPYSLDNPYTLNPLRQDSHRIPFGSRFLEVGGGVGRQARFLAMNLMGWKKVGNDFVPLRDFGRNFEPEEIKGRKKSAMGDIDVVRGEFLMRLLHPAITLLWNQVDKTDFYGIERPRWELALNAVTPLSFSSVPETISTSEGPIDAAATLVLLFLGQRMKLDYNDRDFLEILYPTKEALDIEVERRLYNGLNPSASDWNKVKALKAVAGMDRDEMIQALRNRIIREARAEGRIPDTRYYATDPQTGRQTKRVSNYGERLSRLNALLREAEEADRKREERKRGKGKRAVVDDDMG